MCFVMEQKLSACIACMTLSTVQQKLSQMHAVKQQAQNAIQQLMDRQKQLNPSYKPSMK